MLSAVAGAGLDGVQVLKYPKQRRPWLLKATPPEGSDWQCGGSACGRLSLQFHTSASSVTEGCHCHTEAPRRMVEAGSPANWNCPRVVGRPLLHK